MPDTCRGDEPGAAEKRWQLTASFGFLDSLLLFDTPLTFHEATVVAGAAWRAKPWLTFVGSIGVLTDGWVRPLGQALQRIQPGPVGALGAVFQVMDGADGLPFSTITLLVSALGAGTADLETGNGTFVAVDFRASAIVGYTLLKRFSPYVGVVVFGGPVYWSKEPAIAGDAYHYQVLFGGSLALPYGFSVFVEGSPLGERSLSGGAGFAF